MSLKFCPTCNKLTKNEAGPCESCTQKHGSYVYQRRKFKRKVSKQEDAIAKFYASQQWRRTRMLCLTRDGGACKHCEAEGIATLATTVHHITEVRDDFERRFDLDNLISLCHECHNKAHQRF